MKAATARLRRRQVSELDVIEGFIQHDATPSLVVDADGRIRTANPAAARRFDLEGQTTLAGVLRTLLANPTGVLFRLQSRAAGTGSAREDVYTRTGILRLSVNAVSPDRYVWRVDHLPGRSAQGPAQESQHLPMIMVMAPWWNVRKS